MPQIGARTGIHVAGLGMHAWGCLTPHAPGGVFKVCPRRHPAAVTCGGVFHCLSNGKMDPDRQT